jgi:hypothetical protein
MTTNTEAIATNAERMVKLDDAWNARDWDTFDDYHDGNTIQPTGKAFDVLYSTTARWKHGKIMEEYLFYDNGTFLKQIGLA